MTEQFGTKFPQFYLTVPAPCPYLVGRVERKVFTQLHGPIAGPLNDALTHSGFRRSQNIAYKPACETCDACVSVRVVVDGFKLKKSFGRIMRANQDIIAQTVPAEATSEQFSILRAYLDSRHRDGGMADMTMLDYASMVEDSSVETRIIEYRLTTSGMHGDTPFEDGQLVGVALSDVLGDGLSMVYSFFDPDFAKRSLGTYMVLEHITRTQMYQLSYLYLGYWVPGSPKMNYKIRYQPLEALTVEGWKLLDPDSSLPIETPVDFPAEHDPTQSDS